MARLSESFLLHTCCSPCATSSAERLGLYGYDVILFFSNSNIVPFAEYRKRLDAARKLSRLWSLPLVVDPYDHGVWRRYIAGTETEPEGGKRCSRCFSFSLSRTALYARRLGVPRFATTLTLSPHKRSKTIADIGVQLPGYHHLDFKKAGGFKRSLELCTLCGIYRQGYCGCEFSLRKAADLPSGTVSTRR